MLYWIVGLAVWLFTAAAASVHAILYKRDPRSAAIWVLLSFSLPLGGPWLYWVLGINRLQRRAFRIRRRRTKDPTSSRKAARENTAAEEEAVGQFSGLRRTGDRITGLPLLPGNRFEPLHNGEEAYPAMLQAIASAQHSITLASYIFDWDEIGMQFCSALHDAARRGVRVHVLLDGIGAAHSWSRVGRHLLESGAQVAPFFPLRFPFSRLSINLRNHRKIVVVDGAIGFTGGMNISQRHLVECDSPNRVEDLHFRVTGPVVAEMQYIFVEDWWLATDRLLEGDAYFPPLDHKGSALSRGVVSGPDKGFQAVEWLLLEALGAAQHSVTVVTPYFLPTVSLLQAMALAALRGVRVTLLLPARLDMPRLRWATDAYLRQLLEHGVRIFRRRGPFVHTKLLVADDRWVLLGSTNLDPRSFRLNFEFDLEVYDPKLAETLGQWLEGLIPQSQAVSLKEVDSQSILVRIRNGAMKLFSPHL